MNIDFKNLNLDVNNLDVNDVGVWPWPVKILTIIVAAVMVIVFGYSIDTKKQRAALKVVQHEEITLRQSLETKQQKAANLDAYKAQMQTMKASFGTLLRQLPEKTEVPGLLEDISHQGLAAGLEFKTIRLLPEKQIDFYVELPIEISVIGSFHQLAEFVSNVASLPRIVTLHDFTIHPNVPAGAQQGLPSGNALIMNITAKTYRYTANETGQ